MSLLKTIFRHWLSRQEFSRLDTFSYAQATAHTHRQKMLCGVQLTRMCGFRRWDDVMLLITTARTSTKITRNCIRGALFCCVRGRWRRKAGGKYDIYGCRWLRRERGTSCSDTERWHYQLEVLWWVMIIVLQYSNISLLSQWKTYLKTSSKKRCWFDQRNPFLCLVIVFVTPVLLLYR